MATPQLTRLPILLLKEGVDTSQGIAQIIGNINACQSIVDVVRTTLGPRGMDKLIHTANGSVTITNDGATVLDIIDIVHPACRILVDIAKAQDAEVGDGTTSVVVMAGELLNEAKLLLDEGVPPRIIIKGYINASQQALNYIKNIQINLETGTQEKKNMLYKKCAETSLNSKLVSSYQDMFSTMVINAVQKINIKSFDKSLIGIKKVPGGSVTESMLIEGVAFKKTFSYAGFEQQPKQFSNPKILLLSVELELKAEKENAEVRVNNPTDYQAIVDAEWKIIYNKLDAIIATGAQVVLSRLPIGDLATQYFADHDIFCAGRVDETDLKRTAMATNGKIQSSVQNLKDCLGVCGQFSEVQIGSERYNIFTGCQHAQSVTMILRGGSQQFLDETERSLNDAIMVVHRAMRTNTIVGGGGAIDMEISNHLRELSRKLSGKQQLIMNAFAKSLECIPKVLAASCGMDQSATLNKLRKFHYEKKAESQWMGIDAINGEICNTVDQYIWEPALVKSHAISAATEAACLILSVDETVKNPKSNVPEPGAQQAMQGMAQRGGRM